MRLLIINHLYPGVTGIPIYNNYERKALIFIFEKNSMDFNIDSIERIEFINNQGISKFDIFIQDIIKIKNNFVSIDIEKEKIIISINDCGNMTSELTIKITSKVDCKYFLYEVLTR